MQPVVRRLRTARSPHAVHTRSTPASSYKPVAPSRHSALAILLSDYLAMSISAAQTLGSIRRADSGYSDSSDIDADGCPPVEPNLLPARPKTSLAARLGAFPTALKRATRSTCSRPPSFACAHSATVADPDVTSTPRQPSPDSSISTASRSRYCTPVPASASALHGHIYSFRVSKPDTPLPASASGLRGPQTSCNSMEPSNECPISVLTVSRMHLDQKAVRRGTLQDWQLQAMRKRRACL